MRTLTSLVLAGCLATVATPARAEPSIEGRPSTDVIQRVIRRKAVAIRICYERELTRRPGLAGKITVKFVIAPDGTVSSATVTSFDETIGSCVVGVFKKLVFPKPGGGKPITINYPIIFTAA